MKSEVSDLQLRGLYKKIICKDHTEILHGIWENNPFASFLIFSRKFRIEL